MNCQQSRESKKYIKNILKIGFLLGLVALGACQQITPNANRRDLGSLELAFSDSGTAKAWFTPNELQTQASAVDESLLTFSSDAQAAYTNSVFTDSRILVARFKIANNTGANINRLTLVAWAKPTNIGQSALNSMTNFGGKFLSPAFLQTNLAVQTEPVHATTGNSQSPTVDSSNADLQLFSESENTELETLAGLSGQLLPYGFVARNNTNVAANRRVVNSTNTVSDGQVTIALRVPSNNSNTYGFRMTFRVISEPTANPIYVQSAEEQLSSPTTFGGEVVSSLPSNASLRILPGGSQNLNAAGMVNTRIAGVKGSPTGVIRPWLFNPASSTVSVGFSQLAIPSGFTVKRSQGLDGALEPVPTPLSSNINFRAPASQSFQSNELLQMGLKNVKDRDGFSFFPRLIDRGYSYERVAPVTSTVGAGTFAGRRTNYTLQSGLTEIFSRFTFANVDNDPALELILVYSATSSNILIRRLQIYDLGNTTPILTQGLNCSSCAPVALVVADYNNDQKMDLAIISTLSATTSSLQTDIVLNTTQTADTAPSFANATASRSFQLPVSTSNILSAKHLFRSWDVNSDGSTDLAIATRDGVWIVTNNGDGSFEDNLGNPNIWTSVTAFGDYSFTDIDNDGDLDISLVSQPNTNVNNYTTYKLNTTNGNYSTQTSHTFSTNTAGDSARGQLVDINNDGYADFVTVGGYQANGGSNQLEVYLNNGLGEFPSTPSRISTLGFGSYYNATANQMRFADLDHDKDLDLILESTGGLLITKNDGNGNFASLKIISANDIQLVDWNNDGSTDISFLSVSPTDIQIGVFLNN